MTSTAGQGRTASDVVAANIRQARKRLGWNTVALAARCAETGRSELTAAVIQNIQDGRRGEDGRRSRKVTVEELAAFSRALGVPAAVLCPELGQAPDPAPFVCSQLDDMIARLQELKNWLGQRHGGAPGQDGNTTQEIAP